MSKINDGGPAFPCSNEQLHSGHAASGMSLRDWFAGMALTGMLANGFKPSEAMVPDLSSCDFDDPEDYDAYQARNNYTALAYRLADAMLAAREGGAS